LEAFVVVHDPIPDFFFVLQMVTEGTYDSTEPLTEIISATNKEPSTEIISAINKHVSRKTLS